MNTLKPCKKSLEPKRKEEAENLVRNMEKTIKELRLICLMDETSFSQLGNHKTWSGLEENITMTYDGKFCKNILVCTVVTRKGLLHYKLYNSYLNGAINLPYARFFKNF